MAQKKYLNYVIETDVCKSHRKENCNHFEVTGASISNPQFLDDF